MKRQRFWRVPLALAGILFLASSVWAAPGSLLWSTSFNISSSYSTISITAMAASQTTLIICGNASGTAITPLQMGFIRAFDVTNGHSKWNYDLFLGSMTNNFSAITIDGDLAVVMGTAYGMEPDGVTLLSKAVLYACNADTGVSSWATAQNFYSSAPGPYLTSNTTLMTTANNRTFLAVIAPKVGEPGMPGDCWVRAFQEKNSPTEAATFLLLD